MQDARQKVFEITDSRGVEIAFEALGIPATWMTALDVFCGRWAHGASKPASRSVNHQCGN
ncbi:alcohol dehydrogenase [Cutibacterium acnes]|nr:alcohol dehydrogenase [Cutibacterium acnes]REB17581.1 alcohol dehydrogenase [Cutibacterium acnes]